MSERVGSPVRDVLREYQAVLRAYVRAPSEALRERAYRLGHGAVARGLGVLAVAAAHNGELVLLVRRSRSPEQTEQTVTRASELLLEGLAAFEMTHRGFKESLTHLIAANEALRGSEAKNQALLQAIPDTMFRVSRDGTCLDFNAGVSGVPLPSPDITSGENISKVWPGQLAQLVMVHVEQALQAAVVQSFEHEFVLDGDRHNSEFRLAASGPDEVIGIVRDITERQQAATERERLVRKPPQN